MDEAFRVLLVGRIQHKLSLREDEGGAWPPCTVAGVSHAMPSCLCSWL